MEKKGFMVFKRQFPGFYRLSGVFFREIDAYLSGRRGRLVFWAENTSGIYPIFGFINALHTMILYLSYISFPVKNCT